MKPPEKPFGHPADEHSQKAAQKIQDDVVNIAGPCFEYILQNLYHHRDGKKDQHPEKEVDFMGKNGEIKAERCKNKHIAGQV